MNRNEREHRIGGMNHMNRHVTWMLSESNQRRVPIDMNDILRDYSTDVDAMSVYKGILHKNQMGMGYGPYALT